jgi:hypothetical protein
VTDTKASAVATAGSVNNGRNDGLRGRELSPVHSKRSASPQTLRVRCRCGREGALPAGTALTRALRCTGCGQRSQVREIIIEEPTARSRRRPTASEMKSAAAREILARYRVGELDDDLSDLFRAVRHEHR